MNLAAGSPDDPFDVLIVGGGATGTGIAVDAVTRYLTILKLRDLLLPCREGRAGGSQRSREACGKRNSSMISNDSGILWSSIVVHCSNKGGSNYCHGDTHFVMEVLVVKAKECQRRGLRTALVEREDFGSQTSSKSTKLVHGGVRYLEKAVFNLDYGQLKLVFEALHERKHLIENAPHLAHSLPIMTVSPASLALCQPSRGKMREGGASCQESHS